MIVCEYCKREFESKQAFYAHKCDGFIKERQELKKQKEEENANGNFVCNGCGKHYKKMSSLRSHARFCENYVPIKKYDENGQFISNSIYKNGDVYVCECGKEFVFYQSLNAHFSHCNIHHLAIVTEHKLRPHEIDKCMCGWKNKSEEEINKIHEKSGKSLSENLKTGKTKNHWCGKKHSEETKEKKRIVAINLRKEMVDGCCAAYNKKGCEYIDKLNEEKGWHLQHALNGGEIEVGGYFLDGYDEKNNIVFEYDEPKHYKDVYNNILKDKDIERQNYIIQKLHCDFYRYNEKINLLYEVTLTEKQ